MKSANLVLWVAGLGLHSLLLLLLIRRRLLRLFPVFSCLIAFYIVRSALLYSLSSFQSVNEVGNFYDLLSIADLFLQVLLVIEIAIRSSGRMRSGSQPRFGVVILQLGIEGAGAAVIAVLMPEPMRVPVDRGMIFVTILMSVRLAWTFRNRVTGLPRAIAAGFSFYGAIVIGAALVQNLAVENRNATEFTVASYTKAIVYLAVVVFWAQKLPVASDQEHPQPLGRGRHRGGIPDGFIRRKWSGPTLASMD